MNTKRVLVTGAAGYIGSILAQKLVDAGYDVHGVDRLLFGDAAVAHLSGHPRFRLLRGDVRDPDVWSASLNGAFAVVHLAAIVGDPACALYPDLARETNLEASKRLFEAAGQTASVERFVFASTCSNYGRQQGEEYCDEETPLAPLSLYAETKVAFERYMLTAECREDFVPTALRFATAYGLSRRMRFDLTVNEFTREVALGRRLEIYGRQFWRPYCHADDLARACHVVLEAPPDKVGHQAFNVGATEENYTKTQLAALLTDLEPRAEIAYVHREEDPRDYKVDFSKIASTLDFAITRRVPDGVREIHASLAAGEFCDPDAAVFNNSTGARL